MKILAFGALLATLLLIALIKRRKNPLDKYFD